MRDHGTIRFTLLIAAFMMLLVASGCDGPSASFGPEDPRQGNGWVNPVSAEFTRSHLERLYQRLNSAEFQRQLARYSCGDPVPKLEITVSLWKEGEYRHRHVLIQPRPMFNVGGRERCLNFGLPYLVEVETGLIDRGTPINYHERNPQTGKEFAPEVYARHVPREPVCDCSKRDGTSEWVDWPEPTPTH